MSFSERLQTLRKEKHLSQKQLADAIGVSRQTISKWESSLTPPAGFYIFSSIIGLFLTLFLALKNHRK